MVLIFYYNSVFPEMAVFANLAVFLDLLNHRNNWKNWRVGNFSENLAASATFLVTLVLKNKQKPVPKINKMSFEQMDFYPKQRNPKKKNYLKSGLWIVF